MKTFTTLFAAVMLTACASAEIETRTVTYEHGDTTLTGYLAWDSDMHTEPASAPAVLIVHQWMGLTDYEKRRARQLAELGYVAFALDIYGTDYDPSNTQQAGKASGAFKGDRKLFRERLNLGLNQLKKVEAVDHDRIAAIGYCFGGTGVLELARSGADIAGVVSFHGGLDSPRLASKPIKAKVLICHGADDPYVPEEGIDAMKKEFNEADVDWQMIYYADAVHSFTQPMAGDDPSQGAAYNEKADKRSWQHMRVFFDEVLGPVE